MARSMVTGAAGFIGSHLVEALLDGGDEVEGVDSFTEIYPQERKRANLARALDNDNFRLHEVDLREADLEQLVRDVDVVFHLAAIPGVRASWGEGFRAYLETNVLGTQRLLEACRQESPPKRFVYASSSSVYGEAPSYPVSETDPTRPRSPYGVTKLAAEHLCHAYADNFGLQAVALRYFSVYGPRQRPDMGVNRLLEHALGRSSFTLFGSGDQVRDMTYVSDVVAATVAAATRPVEPGTAINVAGGSQVAVNDVIELIGRLLGSPVEVNRDAEQPGDVQRTAGDTSRARDLLDWKPTVAFEDGLRAQLQWQSAASENASSE